MDILQEDNNRLIMCNIGKKFGAIVEGEIAHLAGVIQDAFQVFTVRVIQTDQVTDEVGIQSRNVRNTRVFLNPLLEFLSSHCSPVVFLDFKCRSEDAAQKRIWDLGRLLRSTSFEDLYRAVLQIKPFSKLE